MASIDYTRTPDYGNGSIPYFTGKHKAANTRAWLARAEWQDYQNRFAPKEKELIQRVSQQGAIEELDNRLGSISFDTGRAFAANRQAVDMSNQRYGVQQAGQIEQDQSRKSSLNQQLSEVDAINRTRDNIATRNMNVVGGGGLTGRQLLNEGA